MSKIGTLLGLIVFGLVFSFGLISVAKTPDGETPATETVCDGHTGALYGLCVAYCEAMDCDSAEPNASERACERVRANYNNHHPSGTDPPCVDPCAILAAIAECPCNYFAIPFITDCWTATPFIIPCTAPACGLPGSGGICFLDDSTTVDNASIDAFRMQFFNSCGANSEQNGLCPTVNEFKTVTDQQFPTCLCRVAQYTNELDQQPNIAVSDTGPPFSCEPSSP